MEKAYTVWTYLKSQFGITESTEEGRALFEQGVREVSDLGFHNIECFNFTAVLFEDYPEEFQRIMRENHAKFVNIYHAMTDDFQKDYEMAERCFRFLRTHGAGLMNLETPRRNGAEATEERMAQLCEHINRIGQLGKQYGVTVCLHPHYWTFCENQEMLTYVDEHTDPELIKYCIDTCHCVLGKMDPVATFERYADRLAYVHLKDISSDENEHPEFPIKRCRALGEGIVDFRGVMDVLRRHEYDGYLCVEVDWPRLCNYETAMVSARYLHNVLRL